MPITHLKPALFLSLSLQPHHAIEAPDLSNLQLQNPKSHVIHLQKQTKKPKIKFTNPN